MKKNGSALLIVIFITSLLSLITFNIWFKSSLFLNLVIERETFYKNFYLSETLMSFCIDFVKNQYNDIYEQEAWPIKYNLNFLLEAIKKTINNKDLYVREFCAEMILNKQKENYDQIQIFINLNNKEPYKTLCSLSCNLKKKEIKKGEKNNESLQQPVFIIKNYSIGSVL